MALSSLGIGSGLDVNSIISQLMALEQQPLANLAKKEAGIQAKMSAIGNLKGALSTFQNAVNSLSSPSKFQSVRVSSSDSAIVNATGNSQAEPGSHRIEVSKLAQAQKLVAVGQASSSGNIGTGTITIDFGTIELGESGSFDSETGQYTGASFTSSGSGVKTITINETNSSLTGIRDAINSAAIGVTASIINDGGDSPYRLVLTQKSTGKTGSMKISVEGDSALKNLLEHDPAGTQSLRETMTAQNAEFSVDGLAVSKTTNTVTDVLTGVTLTLDKVTDGKPITISVSKDTSAVSSAVDQFVNAYNQLQQTLTSLTSYNAETRQASALTGDATARSIQTQLRSMVSTSVEGAGKFKLLNDIGVTLQTDGKLGVDKAKLDKAINENFGDIANLFAAAGRSTDSLVSFVSATDKTKPGSYAVEVTQLATQGKFTAAGAASLTIGADNDTLEVVLDGTKATITLEHDTYASASALAAHIQSKINGIEAFKDAGSRVSVTQSGGVLNLTSSRYGSVSHVLVTGGNGLESLFGSEPVAIEGTDVAGTIGGVPAMGSGRQLIGAIGSDADGLRIEITGTTLGSRGTVSYAKGYAHRFNELVNSWLDEEGMIGSRIDGINATLKDINSQRERLNLRLETVEKRYRAQFTALDLALSRMSETSNYLAQQLANLPKIE